MPTLRRDNGNKWMARVVIHNKQIACKMFPAGKKYGQAWRQAKTWEDEQKNLAMKTFESEQREIALIAFQNEQKALALKIRKEGNKALTQKVLKEEQKALELTSIYEEQVRFAYKQPLIKINLSSVENENVQMNSIKQDDFDVSILESQNVASIPDFQAVMHEVSNNTEKSTYELHGSEEKEDTSVIGDKVSGYVEVRQAHAVHQEKNVIEQKHVRKRIRVGQVTATSQQPTVPKSDKTRTKATQKLSPFAKWGKKYLEHVERTMSPKTLSEKKSVMHNFYAFCKEEGIDLLDSITPAVAYEFLSEVKDERGSNVANKYRKNLLAAWTWAVDFIDGFSQGISPFGKVKNFATQRQDRYVPPEEDIIKVLQQATGQDLVLLLTLYFTGARRGEIFRLCWNDVNLMEEKIRLSDNKAGNGQQRVRWIQMHPELVKALRWWEENRPCKVDNVFMQTHCKSNEGKSFTQRRNFMENLCQKAGVKTFGFHAIRHKSAAITFAEFGLNAAQSLMGHYRATTTDIYIKSAGLYSNQDEILTALGKNGIGQMAGDLLKSNGMSDKMDSVTENAQDLVIPSINNIEEECFV